MLSQGAKGLYLKRSKVRVGGEEDFMSLLEGMKGGSHLRRTRLR